MSHGAGKFFAYVSEYEPCNGGGGGGGSASTFSLSIRSYKMVWWQAGGGRGNASNHFFSYAYSLGQYSSSSSFKYPKSVVYSIVQVV